MKKLLLSVAFLTTTMGMAAQDLQLPQPDKSNPTTLFRALEKRQSSRSFSATDLSDAQLSTILWAACGINRPESGRITAPSALNAQDILVYVVRKDGAYRYQPKENKLQKVSGKDLRMAVAGGQAFAADAPVSFVLVSDHGRFGDRAHSATRMGLIDCGYVSMNISLACAAMGLENVPRMTMDSDALRKELGLGENMELILNQQVGYAK